MRMRPTKARASSSGSAPASTAARASEPVVAAPARAHQPFRGAQTQREARTCELRVGNEQGRRGEEWLVQEIGRGRDCGKDSEALHPARECLVLRKPEGMAVKRLPEPCVLERYLAQADQRDEHDHSDRIDPLPRAEEHGQDCSREHRRHVCCHDVHHEGTEGIAGDGMHPHRSRHEEVQEHSEDSTRSHEEEHAGTVDVPGLVRLDSGAADDSGDFREEDLRAGGVVGDGCHCDDEDAAQKNWKPSLPQCHACHALSCLPAGSLRKETF